MSQSSVRAPLPPHRFPGWSSPLSKVVATTYKLDRKVDVRLPGEGNSISHGARPVHIIITMIKRIRTSRLSINNSHSSELVGTTFQGGGLAKLDSVIRRTSSRLATSRRCPMLFSDYCAGNTPNSATGASTIRNNVSFVPGKPFD